MSLLTNIVSYYKMQGNSTDSVGSNNGTDTAITYSDANGKIGNGAGVNGTTSQIIIDALGSTFSSGNSYSVSAWVYVASSFTGQPFSAVTTTTWGVGAFEFSVRGTSGLNIEFTGVSWLSGTLFSVTGATTSNSWNHIVAVSDGSTKNLYINGTLANTTSTSVSQTFTNFSLINTRATNIGYRGGASGKYIDEVGVWSRALTGSEVTSLYNSGAGKQYPFSLDYILSCVVGAFTLTSIATVLKLGRKILMSVGVFTLTGINTLLHIGRKILMSAGLFTLTSINILFHVALSIPLTVGSFVLTSIDTMIRKGKTLMVDAGNFIVTGNNVLFHVMISMILSVGNFTLTGVNTLFHYGRKVLLDAGSFILTGVNLNVKRGYNMMIDTGNYILTSIDIIFRNGKRVIMSAGSFTLTGVNTIFHYGRKMIMGTGSFTLTGFIAKFPLFWRTIVKHIVSIGNSTKHSSTWRNEDKTNVI